MSEEKDVMFMVSCPQNCVEAVAGPSIVEAVKTWNKARGY